MYCVNVNSNFREMDDNEILGTLKCAVGSCTGNEKQLREFIKSVPIDERRDLEDKLIDLIFENAEKSMREVHG